MWDKNKNKNKTNRMAVVHVVLLLYNHDVKNKQELQKQE